VRVVPRTRSGSSTTPRVNASRMRQDSRSTPVTRLPTRASWRSRHKTSSRRP
jgi:hypothetical protein